MASSSRLTMSEASESSLPTAPANVYYSPNSDKDFVLPLLAGEEGKQWRATKGTFLNKQEQNLLDHLWAIPQIKQYRQNYQKILNCLNVYFHYQKRTGKQATSVLGSSSNAPNLRPNNASRSFSHYVVFNGNKYGVYTKWTDVEASILGMDEPMWEGFNSEKQAQLALHSYRISVDVRNTFTNRQVTDKKSASLNKQFSEFKKTKTEEIANLQHEIAFLKFQLALRDQANNQTNLPISEALLALPNALQEEIKQITTQTEYQRNIFILDFLAEHLRDIPGLQVDMEVRSGKYAYVFPEVTICFPDFLQVEIACKTLYFKDLIELGVVSKVLIEGEGIPPVLPLCLQDAIHENGLRPDKDPIRITCYSTPVEWRLDSNGDVSLTAKAVVQFLLHQPKTRDPYFLSEISCDKFSQAHGTRYRFSAQDLVRRKAHTMFETLAQCQYNHTLIAEDPPIQVYGETPTSSVGNLLWVTRRPTLHCEESTEQLADWFEADHLLSTDHSVQPLDKMESDSLTMSSV
ncbi:hypothetical protein Dsin_000184 [Dipteronia sinensis]|uniref:Ribonuclease H1 N-terminal domain-containing protein n=1 Tax=Dipteronia sinensis TaxID=43782 RepID=A0AAD9Z0C0_9ROSI|nr:hypothetical protein Dsin_000184 [Dipteronia sinensis]